MVICYRCRSVSHSQAGSWSTVYGVGMYAVRCYTRLPAFLSQGSAEHDGADTPAAGDDPVKGMDRALAGDPWMAMDPHPTEDLRPLVILRWRNARLHDPHKTPATIAGIPRARSRYP